MNTQRALTRRVVGLLVGAILVGLPLPARAEVVPAGLTAGEWQEVRRQIGERPYRLEAVAGGGYRAANPAQGWMVGFDAAGVRVRPAEGDWQWGLQLVAYGYPGAERRVSGPSRLSAAGPRVDYEWDADLTEWLRNGPDGVKQTFVLARRPAPGAGAGPLGLALRVGGSLEPRLVEAGQGVSFADARGGVRLTYRGLVVFDAAGQRVPAGFEVAGGVVALRVDDRQATYPLTVDPIAQQAYLKASNTGAEDQFGQAVAVSGDTVVVGAQGEDSAATGVNGPQTDNTAGFAGAAYVFVRSGGVWTQQAYLKASNTGAGDRFGQAVAVSGDTVVVGRFLEASAATGVNGNQADNSAANAGAAYVFVRSGGVWTQQAYLKAFNTGAGDAFGFALAVSGDTVVVGALGEDSAATGVNGPQGDNTALQAGAAYVFVRSGGLWSQQAYLKASNTGAGDVFGVAVAVSGDTVVVGALGEDSAATGVNGPQADNTASNAGAAYVFTGLGPTRAIVTGAGAGGGPHVRVIDARTGAALAELFAYNPAFTGGVRVAVADVTGDGVPDIITGPGPGGGPHIQVFDGAALLAGGVVVVRSFFAYDRGFTGGVFVGAADLNGDGKADIITGAGAGGGSHVRAFDGATGAPLALPGGSFFAYDPSFTGGVFVAGFR